MTTDSTGSASAREPSREFIEQGLLVGRNAMSIWQELVDRHGFTGAKETVKRRTRHFVLTLGFSRKCIRLLSFQSSSQIWAELHETAFRRLDGTTKYVVLDNLSEGVLSPDIYDPKSILSIATCSPTTAPSPCPAVSAIRLRALQILHVVRARSTIGFPMATWMCPNPGMESRSIAA